jgi:uncharacterized protein (UPF0335 family)
MPEVGGIAGDRLRNSIERIERLEEKKRATAADIKEVYAEAKIAGLDTKTMCAIIKERRMTRTTWTSRPDIEIWVDPGTDLPCLLHRHEGTWCGYVGVPPGHRADGLNYYKSEYDIEEVETGRAAELLPVQKAVNNISVYGGGLTFAGKRAWLFPEGARCRDWHFFGFDCNHAGDYAYAKAGVTSLAAQLAAISSI